MSAEQSKRIVWLDVLRTICAIEIAGFHWLRATVKLGILAQGQPDNFVLDYRQLSWGFSGLHNALLSHAASIGARVTENTIGFLFEFGWEAVHVFVLLSGFSLAWTLAQRSGDPAWGRWMLKRGERILIPFYVVSLPLVALMLGLSRFSGQGVAAQMAQKLLLNGANNVSGLLIGQILLIDPHRHLWVPVFLSPAWWFVPAILVSYLVFPLLWIALGRWRPRVLLPVSLAVSLLTYTACLHNWMFEFGWYFVAFNEAFNFCLGAILGRAYASVAGRLRIEEALRSWSALSIGITLVAAGNICNLYRATYPISSSLFTIGLTIVGGHLAMHLARLRLSRPLSSIDPYVLYLVHQPFAYPVAVIIIRLHIPETIAFGLVLYLVIVIALTRLEVGAIGLVDRALKNRKTDKRGVSSG